jgi:quinol monooxygenase YgiN
MTVISILEFTVKAEALAGAAAVVHDVLTATRAREGSLGIEVTVDVDDPAHYLVVERWDSIESDDAYRAWRASPGGKSALGDILAGPPTLTRALLTDTL